MSNILTLIEEARRHPLGVIESRIGMTAYRVKIDRLGRACIFENGKRVSVASVL